MEHLAADPVLAAALGDAFDGNGLVAAVLEGRPSAAFGADVVAALSGSGGGSSGGGGGGVGVGEAADEALRARVEALEGALRAAVAAHQESFLTSAGGAPGLKAAVAAAAARLAGVAGGVARVEADVMAPAAALEADTRTLRNVLAATDALRKVQRALLAARRLRAVLPPPTTSSSSDGTGGSLDARTLARAAPLLAAVEDELAAGGPALARIPPVAAEVAWVGEVGAAARGAARAAWVRAVDALAAADVGSAASVLADLRTLPAEAAAAGDRAAGTAAGGLREALDVRRVAGEAAAAIEGGAGTTAGAAAARAAAGGPLGPCAVAAAAASGSLAVGSLVPSAGAAAAWRGVLWSRVEGMCEGLQRATLQVWNLAFVVSLKRHSVSRSPLVASLPYGRAGGSGGDAAAPSLDDDDPRAAHPAVALLRRYWLAATGALHEEVAAIVTAEVNGFVKATLADGYTRLHYILLDVLHKVRKSVALRAASELTLPLPHPDGRTTIPSMDGSTLLAAACDARRLVWAVAPLMRLHLARSLTRMTEALGAMFTPAAGRAGGGRRPVPRPPTLPSTAVAAAGSAFSSAAEVERAMDEVPPVDAPSAAATAAFMKLAAGELAACRPAIAAGSTAASAAAAAAVAGGGGSGGGAGSFGASLPRAGAVSASVVLSSMAPDAALAAAVARGVATALKLLVARTEGAAVSSGAAVMVADHFMPSPAQLHNFALAARVDDARRGVARLLLELPPPPGFEEEWAAAREEDTGVRAWGARRAAASPLSHRLPAPVAALAAAIDAAGSDGGRAGLAQSAQGFLLPAVAALDRAVDALLLPWLGAVAGPLEGAVAALHEAGYGSGGDASAPESAYTTRLASYTAALAAHQLPLLPAGGVGDAARALLAGRLATLFVRHVCLHRRWDDASRARLTRDADAVTGALAQLCELGKLGRAYSELRAVRPLLHVPTPDLLDALVTGGGSGGGDGGDASAARRGKIVTLLRSLRGANVLHALLARLPDAASMPYTQAGVSPAAYSDWMDATAVAAAAAAAGGALAAGAAGLPTLVTGLPAVAAGVGGAAVVLPPAVAPLRLVSSDAGNRAVDDATLPRARACAGEYVERAAAVGGAGPGAEAPEVQFIVGHGAALLALGAAPSAAAARTARPAASP